jgi:hypothetical protein
MMYMARRSPDFSALMDPLERYLVGPDCTEDQVEIAIDLITRLWRAAEANDIRIFPHLAKAQRERKDTYTALLSELYEFARTCATTPNQKRIMKAMEQTWPAECGLAAARQPAAEDTWESLQRQAELVRDRPKQKDRGFDVASSGPKKQRVLEEESGGEDRLLSKEANLYTQFWQTVKGKYLVRNFDAL